MPPSRPRSWGTAGSSTSPASWGAIPRPSARGSLNWRARTTWIRAARAKRGRTQAADRGRLGGRGELPQGARGPYRGRPDAARGEVDELVAAPDRASDRRVGDSCQSSRRLPVTPRAPVPQAEGAEEEDDGPASQGSQRPVREHRPPQGGVPQ